MQLHDYQRTGVEWLLTPNYMGRLGKLLGDGVGVGKSTQVLKAAERVVSRVSRGIMGVAGFKADVLIVGPKSVASSWRSEITLWRPDLEVVDPELLLMSGEHGDGGQPSLSSPLAASTVRGPWCAVTWPAALPDVWRLGTWRTGRPLVVIIDEPHEHRSHDSKWVQRIAGWTRMGSAVWGTTGTPLFNRPDDLRVCMTLLGFNVASDEYQRLVVSGILRSTLVERGLLLARSLGDVAGELRLPPLTRSLIDAPLPVACVQSNMWRTASNAATLRKVAGLWKWDLVQMLLDADRVQAESPTVLWYVHKDAAKHAHGELVARGIFAEVVTGSVSEAKRAAIFDAFQRQTLPDANTDGPDWLVLTACAQAGVQLQRARTTIIAELPWQTKAQAQAVARMWRQGQQHPTREFTLAWRHDVDQHVLDLCYQKAACLTRLGF